MFHIFKDQNERIAYGGTAFIELQYCKLKAGTRLNKIVALRSIRHWQDNSLYVYVTDIDNFLDQYHDIFQGVDCSGINYYSPNQLNEIVAKLESKKPVDYSVLLEWLKQGIEHNGIYILGI
ncbi:MAG: hypothetical protein J1F71_00015 [Clostridiales bacterium]|nr:hypothetical protein [Clostridiales bacterium]